MLAGFFNFDAAISGKSNTKKKRGHSPFAICAERVDPPAR